MNPLSFLAPFALAIGLAAAPLEAAEPADALDAAIAKQMDEGDIAGVGAAIIVDGKVVWTKGYGFADIQRAVPFTPDTVMNIASITKTITGVAIMKAVEAGKLSLDADINTYLPFKVVNPHRPDAKITLRHLATHTSGISDRWEVYEKAYHWGGDAPDSLAAFLESYLVAGGASYAKENFADADPATHYEYSNIGASLAGFIVERAVGEKLQAYTKHEVFAPLGMTSTAWSLADVAPGRHATLYASQGGFTVPIVNYGMVTYPEGGVRTSVADLSKLFIALLGDGSHEGKRVLAKTSVDEMTRLQFNGSNKPANLGLDKENSGIFWATKLGVTRVGHGGRDPGVRADMLASLSKDVGVVLFANTSFEDEKMKPYVMIFRELWKRAEALRDERRH